MEDIGRQVGSCCLQARARRPLILTSVQCELNCSTVAIAQLNFDRVVMAGLITKEHRKVLAACCLVLAYKFDASTKPSVTKSYLKELFKVQTSD